MLVIDSPLKESTPECKRGTAITIRAHVVTQVYCQMEALRYCLPTSARGILDD
jgi:hypothetical protein